MADKIEEKNKVKEKTKTTLYQIRLPDELIGNLDKLANRTGATLNQYVVSTLLERVEKSEIWTFTQK